MTEVTDLQAEIAKEYSKEFMCEGQMFYYYKRLGLKRIGVYRTVAIEPEEVYASASTIWASPMPSAVQ